MSPVFDQAGGVVYPDSLHVEKPSSRRPDDVESVFSLTLDVIHSALVAYYRLTEDEAISLMSIGVDFGVTQVVDGNWGIHAIIKKSLFAGMATA